jgi:TM2 domain-containing membrane protein YozV
MSEETKDPDDKAGKMASDAANESGSSAQGAAEQAGAAGGQASGEAKEQAGDFKEEAKKTASEFTEGLKDAGGENKKILAGILAIILGGFGIHKFILGYQKEGIILLVLSVIGIATTCIIIGSFVLMATWAIGVIEGIIYLTKTDAEFYNTYQVGKRPWF